MTLSKLFEKKGFLWDKVIVKWRVRSRRLGSWASAKGGRVGHALPGFSHTLSKTFQISKILRFLVVNTGSILIGLPLKKFLPTPLRELALTWILLKGKALNQNLKNFPKLSKLEDVMSKRV